MNSQGLMQSPLLTEEQRFRQPWLWAGLFLSFLGILYLWYGVYEQTRGGKPFGDNPATDDSLFAAACFATLIVLAVTALIGTARLVVSIGVEGIEYRFFPFHRTVHAIAWADVAKAYVRRYRPIIEYGGWGIRFGIGGRAYNVSGMEGIQLELKDGRRVLFGTQRASEVAPLLEQFLR